MATLTSPGTIRDMAKPRIVPITNKKKKNIESYSQSKLVTRSDEAIKRCNEALNT